MHYKVCVMAAGEGTRLSYAKNFNKALLPVGEKSAFSRIIEKFPKNVEIVIAIGYKGDLIKEFSEVAYPDRKITLVEVDKWGKGAGPGYALNFCRKHLQCPFIFTSADTIVEEAVPEPDKNWLGVARADDPKDYCMADVDNNGLVTAFHTKLPLSELLKKCCSPKKILDNAFIGMAGVFDYKKFWQGFENNPNLVKDELQVTNGLENLFSKKLFTKQFTWFDTGNDESYRLADQHFSKLNLLAKPGEFLYFENGLVIKYFADKKIVADRNYRASKLKGIVPEICFKGKYFYAYRFVNGELLSKIDNVGVFNKFLKFCQKNLWQPIELDVSSRAAFREAIKSFYLDKTRQRVEQFYKETGIEDKEEIINGVKTPPLKLLFEKIDWDNFLTDTPVLCHGDLQPENVIVHNDFTLIDWRHDFGGLTDYGDIYYDFAKLYHALIISGEIIRKGDFKVKQDKDSVHLSFLRKNNLLEFEKVFDKFLISNRYDLDKVKLLTGLVFLNIAPLYRNPYNLFLYYLGKSSLYKVINKQKYNLWI